VIVRVEMEFLKEEKEEGNRSRASISYLNLQVIV
jgi:hypothetical protein